MIILAIYGVVYNIKYKLSEKENNALKTENTSLKKDKETLTAELSAEREGVKKFNESQIQASNIIAQLRKEAANNKKDCDCYNLRVDDAFINILPKH